MSLIGKEIGSFEAKAYHNGKFIDVSSEDLKENGTLFVLPCRFLICLSDRA